MYTLDKHVRLHPEGRKQGLPLCEGSQQFQASFAVEADHADRSVFTFIHELEQHQLVLLPEQ